MPSIDTAFEATLLGVLASRGRLAAADGGTSPLTVAIEFWRRAAGHAPVSKAFRAIAGEMVKRLSA